MKNIVDIYEKLKVDDIIFDEFPIGRKTEDIIKFLEKEGFTEEMCDDPNISIYDVDNAKKKVYIIIDTQVFFADTSKEKISEYNPIFLCSDKGDLNIFYFDFTNNHYIDIVKIGKDNSTKKAFMKELNKRFGWK